MNVSPLVPIAILLALAGLCLTLIYVNNRGVRFVDALGRDGEDLVSLGAWAFIFLIEGIQAFDGVTTKYIVQVVISLLVATACLAAILQERRREDLLFPRRSAQ